MVFWPHDGKCYTLHTRGPCQKGNRKHKVEWFNSNQNSEFLGKLLAIGKDKLTECLVSVITQTKKIEDKIFSLSSTFSVKMKAN